MLTSSLGATFSFCLVKVAVCEPNKFVGPGRLLVLPRLKLDCCAQKLRFERLLKDGAGGGSYLPLDGKASVGGSKP